uniref:Mitochondrial antiviral-signaling protein n=1 Tax=Myripristis murdjan TaxID=586833 RepID=A0A667Z0C9_9TELE
MSFASDKLYNGFLRRKMPFLASNVKTREIVPHLPCLTQTDREEIEAKRDSSGNYTGMQTLLDCLRKRQNWPEEFITALEACEHTDIAAEIRAEYNSLKGSNNPKPPSPPTTVIKAHVHPAPPAARPVATPEQNGNTQAAVSPPSEAPAPPQPTSQASPPPKATVQPEAHPSPATEAPKAASSSEPPPSLQTSPSTPPPSPETQSRQAATPPPTQKGINAHMEPEENSEVDLQQGSGDQDPISDKANGDRAAPSSPHPVQTATREDRAPQSPAPAQASPAKTVGAAFTMSTPERSPVQETVPPVDKVVPAVLQPEEMSDPTAAQVNLRKRTPSPAAGADRTAAALIDDDVCLSKPGQLLSVAPNLHSPTILAPNSQQQPYSGNSDRLEISEPQLPCQENGVAAEPLHHNEPEENHYESVCQSSLGEQEVLVNVVQVAEEPSIQNQDGQIFRPSAQILNGQATTKPGSAPPPGGPSGDNCHLAASALHESEVKTSPTSMSDNTKYYLTAAGVGVCALMMAWKFKK